MTDREQIEIAKNLFAAWSSGDADAPGEFLTEDAVLHDIVEGGDKTGWPAIREFFALSVRIFPDLELVPQAFFPGETGLALTWIMSATIENDLYGPQHRGKRFRSQGMSTLEFRGDRVCKEVDYHHGPAIQRSLEEA